MPRVCRIQVGSQLRELQFFCMMLNRLELLAVSLRRGRGHRNSRGCSGLERRDSLAKHLAFPF